MFPLVKKIAFPLKMYATFLKIFKFSNKNIHESVKNAYTM